MFSQLRSATRALLRWRGGFIVAVLTLATRALFVQLTQVNAIVPSMWVGALLLSGGVAAFAVALATYRIVRLEPSVVLRRL